VARPAHPTEIASGCLFMASDDASYCNGSVLVMDGGSSVVQH
jgi:NAD(P)-dependent dehydrogenase (short-subunit alcohol dehydrogenase family)